MRLLFLFPRLQASAHAVQIGIFVRFAPGAAGFPDHFAKAIQHHMQCSVRISALAQRLVQVPDSARLIQCQLLADRKMQAQVQKRIHLARFRQVIAVDMARWLIQDWMIFGMHQDNLERRVLQSLQGLACTVFGPGVEKEPARLVA